MYGLWDTKPMPPEFKSNLDAWRRLNPAWTVKVWSKEEVRDMWKTHYPEYKALWKKARPIQRADLARYVNKQTNKPSNKQTTRIGATLASHAFCVALSYCDAYGLRLVQN
jgi:hypothetical protein